MDQAIAAYGAVAAGLGQVADLYPFIGRKDDDILDVSRREQALEALRSARSAEETGLEALAEVVDTL